MSTKIEMSRTARVTNWVTIDPDRDGFRGRQWKVPAGQHRARSWSLRRDRCLGVKRDTADGPDPGTAAKYSSHDDQTSLDRTEPAALTSTQAVSIFTASNPSVRG